jgi:hypothetical protein
MTDLSDDKTQCFYVEGQLTVIDLIKENGEPVFGKSREDTLKRYPEAKVMSFSEAREKIDQLAKEKYLEADPVEISAERFDEMLNILPPAHWVVGDSSSSFQMVERTSGAYTTAFAHTTIDGTRKYFELPVVMGTKHVEIMERISKFLDGGQNA